MNYKSKIYDMLMSEQSDMLDHIPQPDMLFRPPFGDKPTLRGGIRQADHPTPGTFLPKDPATLATGASIGSMRRGDETQSMRRYVRSNDLEESDMEDLSGGRVNWKKVGKSVSKGLKTVGKYATPVLKEVGKEVLPIVKKEGIKALKSYLLPAAETVAANPELLLAAAGRSKKNHKVIRKSYDSDSDEEGSIHIDVNSHKGEKGGARKPNVRAQIVKRIMKEKGLSMTQASSYVKQHNLYKK
jgi:hypothetical protein